jgi:hypothetical protein
MNKSRTKYVTIETLVKEFKDGKIYLDETQRKPSFVDGIIKKHLYYAVNNEETPKFTAKELALVDLIAGDDFDDKWHGETAITLVPKNGGLACSDGGHRNYSFLMFTEGKAKCHNFKYDGNPEIEKFFAKLAKTMGKSVDDSFSFSELPKKYQKLFMGLKLYCVISKSRAKNATGVAFIDSNKQKNQSTQNELNATFAKSEFYKVFKETAACIVNYDAKTGLDKKSTPSWYNKAKKTTQASYIEVCKGLKYTNKKYASVFKLLLRCTNCAEWDGGASKAVHFGICNDYFDVTKKSAVDIIMNTIDNMAIAPMLLDYDYLDGVNTWAAVVYTFGVPSYKSYAGSKKSSTRTPLALSGRFLKNRELFNNSFEDCVAGNKTTFKGTNLVLTNSGKTGTVFVPRMLRESPTDRNNLNVISMVFTAIYNEIKEVH